MKRIVTVLFLLVLAVSAVTALDVSVGVKAGGGLVFGGGDEPPGYDSLILGYGFGGGAAFDVGFHPMAALEVDALYTYMTGYGYKLAGGVEVTSKYSTIEFPVLIKGRFAMGPGKLTVAAGPSMVLMLGEVTTDYNGTEMTGEPDSSFLFGIAGGVGYAVPAGPGDVTLDLRYTRTLTSPYDSTDSFFNRVDLLVGYSYGLMGGE